MNPCSLRQSASLNATVGLSEKNNLNEVRDKESVVWSLYI